MRVINTITSIIWGTVFPIALRVLDTDFDSIHSLIGLNSRLNRKYGVGYTAKNTVASIMNARMHMVFVIKLASQKAALNLVRLPDWYLKITLNR